MKTAILIHGHHLQAAEWERLVWGNEDLSLLGRATKGIQIALRENADLVIFGTGASTDPETGKKESEYTRDLVLARADMLAERLGVSAEDITALINTRSVLQLETKNTKDESIEALKLCKEKGIERIVSISTPTHIGRCILTVCQNIDHCPGIEIAAVACDTVVPFWHPKDVAVIEPPHRPDRDPAPMNLLAKRLASARKFSALAPQLYEDIRERLDRFDAESKSLVQE